MITDNEYMFVQGSQAVHLCVVFYSAYIPGFLSGGAGGAFAPPPWLWLAPPWEFCSDSESIQVF